MDDIAGIGQISTAIGSVFNNVIDKIANATGVLYDDSNYKMKKDAKRSILDKIVENEDFSEFEKVALVSNYNRLFKDYKNQNDIVKKALECVNKEAKIESVDDDFLSYFFDNAKNISSEDIQLVWGKVLANEFNENRSISKTLIHLLSTISNESAFDFNKLCKYSCKINHRYYILVLYGYEYILRDEGLNFEQLSELDRLGLIHLKQSGSNSFVAEIDNKDSSKFILEVCNRIFEIDPPAALPDSMYKKLNVGSVSLTKDGIKLLEIIKQETSEKMIDIVTNYYNETYFNEIKKKKVQESN